MAHRHVPIGIHTLQCFWNAKQIIMLKLALQKSAHDFGSCHAQTCPLTYTGYHQTCVETVHTNLLKSSCYNTGLPVHVGFAVLRAGNRKFTASGM